jgi:hypothetical protein
MDIEEMKREKQIGPMNVMLTPPYDLSVSRSRQSFQALCIITLVELYAT